MERPLEDAIIEFSDYSDKWSRFLKSLTPLQTIVILSLMSGSGVQDVAEACGVDRGVIQDKLQRARKVAIRIYGERALEGRMRTKNRFPVV